MKYYKIVLKMFTKIINNYNNDNTDYLFTLQVNRTAMYTMEIATRFITYVVTLGLTSGQDKILCGDLMFR